MTQTQILIAGHSHIYCLGVPPASEDGSPKVADLVHGDRRFQGVTGGRGEAYWDFLTLAGAGHKVALFWNGNQHIASFLFASPPPFDFFLSSRPGLPVEAGVHVVPESAIRARFEPTFGDLSIILQHLQTGSPECQPVLCGTPPPKGNDERLRGLLAVESHFISVAEQMKVSLQDIELSPPRLRFKLWVVLQKMLEEIAHTYDVPFVAVPASVQTENGFLAEEYWLEDASHANEAYGRVMLDHLAAMLNLPPVSG